MEADISKYLSVDPANVNAYLGIKTVVQGMAIVFIVLILLSLIVMATSAIIRKFSQAKTQEATASALESSGAIGTMGAQAVMPVANVVANQSGTNGSGKLTTDGVACDEDVAIIMAAVAAHSGESLENLKFNSITAVD